MSTVFKDYSQYYDLLYRDKNYESEVNYIRKLLEQFAKGKVEKVLNLGCGTGKHDAYLAEHGYHITGIDFSEDMISIAKGRDIRNASFEIGDVRTYHSTEKFDAVLSLFHVMSYQVNNADIYNSFVTVKKALKPGALFIFDFWYGPCVISEKPIPKEKIVENDSMKIIRRTTPTFIPNENKVDVRFDVEILNKQNHEVQELSELHEMRYLFLPEMRYMLEHAGLTVIKEEEWLTGNDLGIGTWNGCIVASN